MTDTKQPEALRLAQDLEENAELDAAEHCDPGVIALEMAAAAELRRQQARIAELEAENRALKEREEAIGAGGVTGLRSNKEQEQ